MYCAWINKRKTFQVKQWLALLADAPIANLTKKNVLISTENTVS